jgi:hypothetical protein
MTHLPSPLINPDERLLDPLPRWRLGSAIAFALEFAAFVLVLAVLWVALVESP